MLGTGARLVLFYLGYGYLVFLGWAAVISTTDRSHQPIDGTRVRRRATAAAAVGLLHPAFAFAVWDIARTVGRRVPDGGSESTDRRCLVAACASVAIAALVIMSHLHQFQDTPVLSGVREALWFDR
ncbi:MAG: hypothetical protein ACRD0G_17650 [Acidimicrobiales bacterium]